MNGDDNKREMIKELWKDGNTIAEIGAKIGMTRNAVAGVMRRMRAGGEYLEHRPSSYRPVKIRVKKVSILLDWPVGILRLTFRSCRFIVQEGDIRSTKYCNKDIWKQSYCREHYGICYAAPKTPATSLHIPK